MKTFVFYDIETSGLSPAFDQILTFAAIRTDMGLKEIDRTSVTLSLRRDIVPSPGAFITHRLTPEDLKDGCSEYRAIEIIHRLLNTPDTISIGYNSLGFDDEFLRFAFYRNLFDPYTHQYANGCCRMDLLPIATLYRIFKPQAIQWPFMGDKPSMRLELISHKNNLVKSGRAHDAMTDVEATLGLARRLSKEGAKEGSKERGMWDYCLDFFDKKKDEARLGALDEVFQSIFGRHKLGIMVSVPFGSDVMYMAPVLSLGHSRPYANQSLWLRLDREKILPFAPDSDDRPFVIRKRYGEAKIVLPPLERFWNRLTDFQRQVCKKNIELLKNNQDQFQKLVIYYRDFKYPFVPDLDLDASLYQEGFFSKLEKKDINLFHLSSDDEKMAVCTRVDSSRVKGLAERIMLRSFSSMATTGLVAQNDRYLERIRSSAEPIKGYRNDLKVTCDLALEEVASLRAKGGLDAEEESILEWLSGYIESL